MMAWSIFRSILLRAAPGAAVLVLAAVSVLVSACGDGGDGDGVGDDDDDDDDMQVVCPDLGPALPATAPAPPGRGDASGAYDPDCGHVYMLLGDAAVPEMCNFPPQESLDDVYVFDVAARTWHPVAATGGPSPRARSSAAWDPVNRRLLVFGGRTPDGDGYTLWNELWAFDPATDEWTLLSAQDDSGSGDLPLGRINAGVVVDAARNRLILHGGAFMIGTLQFVPFSDTWAWDLDNGGWTAIGEAGETPPARLQHGFALLPGLDRAYAVTGLPESSLLAFWDTWVLDLAADAWSRVEGDASRADAEELARFKPGVVADPSDPTRALLFGGHDNLALGNSNDLWVFDGTTERWRLENEGDVLDRGAGTGFCEFPGDFTAADLSSPERRSAHVFVAAGDHGVVLFGGATDCGKAQDTWILDPTTMTWEEAVPSPSALAMTCARRGLPEGSCIGEDTEMCGD